MGAGFSAGFSAAGSTGVTGSAVLGGFSGSCLGGGGKAGAVVTRRVSRWPGKIRFGLPPMVVRLVSYSACQPPSTCWPVAIAESESPGATTYGFGRTVVPVGTGPPPCAGAVRTTGVAGAAGVTGDCPCVCGATAGAGPLRVSPARFPQSGQAPGPWPFSTFSATAICWSLVARSARGA